MINKRKKNSRLRGSKTHTHGSMKKRRGAGHRGGRGAAGSGKRADTKKPSVWKGKYFGKFGFKGKPNKSEPVNLSYIEENAEVLVERKLISKENDQYTVDITKLGYNKLLGRGKITKKFDITVPAASKHAIEAVKAAGGTVKGIEKENGTA